MEKNRIPLLMGLLVVLLGVAWLAGVFESDPSTIRVPVLDVPRDRVDGLRLSGGEIQAHLEKVDDTWQLVSPVTGRTDSITVARLLDDLTGVAFGSVVSTSAARHARYGVDSTATHAVLSWGRDSTVLVINPSGPDFSSSYVRVGDEPAVYATRARVTLPTALDRLRDKRLATVDPLRVVAASVEMPDARYDLAFGADGWTIAVDDADPEPADSTLIVGWLRRYSPLRMDGFFDTLTPDSVAATHRVRFTQFDGKVVSVAMAEREDAVAAFANDGPAVMRAFASRLSTFFEAPDALRRGN